VSFLVGFIVFFKRDLLKKPGWVFLGQAFLQQLWLKPIKTHIVWTNFCSNENKIVCMKSCEKLVIFSVRKIRYLQAQMIGHPDNVLQVQDPIKSTSKIILQTSR